MNFNLRDTETGKIRRPTLSEFMEITAVFPECTGYRIAYPILVLQCPQAPHQTPTTVGGLPTVFVPDMSEYEHRPGLLGNPRMNDIGGDRFLVADHYYPSFSLLKTAFLVFRESLPNVIRLQYRYDHWIVTLSHSYFDPISLPGKFSGRPVTYRWPDQKSVSSRPRLITPSTTQEDQTDYRAFGLSPGVKVVGKSLATSSGVLVENPAGIQRLTLANHRFLDTDEVYHPDVFESYRLGTIDLRFPLMDIALCQVTSPIAYANHTYFEANPPQQLVTTEFIDENVTTASWFEAEGMSSGLVSLLYSGPAIGYPKLPPYIEEANLLQDYTFTYFGPDAVGVRPGLCGAPVVHEKAYDNKCDGVVIGFVWLNDGRDCIVTALDELLECGWKLSRTDSVV
jgi:hypothetical protein